MDSMLYGVAAFLLFGMLHFILLRLFSAARRVGCIFLLGMSIHLMSVALPMSLDMVPLQYWQLSGTYWFLLMFWTYCYGAAEKSLTVRMLVSVARQGLAVENDLVMIGQRDNITQRLNGLAESDLVERAGNRWRTTVRGKNLARRIFSIQKRLCVSGSSLYQLE